MISVFKNTYLLINIAPFQLKVKCKSFFCIKNPPVRTDRRVKEIMMKKGMME